MFRSVEMEKENRYSFAALGCEELHALIKMKAYVRTTKDSRRHESRHSLPFSGSLKNSLWAYLVHTHT